MSYGINLWGNSFHSCTIFLLQDKYSSSVQLTEALLDIRVCAAIHSRQTSKELLENIGGGEQVQRSHPHYNLLIMQKSKMYVTDSMQ
jgi:hypothetical protein